MSGHATAERDDLELMADAAGMTRHEFLTQRAYGYERSTGRPWLVWHESRRTYVPSPAFKAWHTRHYA